MQSSSPAATAREARTWIRPLKYDTVHDGEQLRAPREPRRKGISRTTVVVDRASRERTARGLADRNPKSTWLVRAFYKFVGFMQVN